MMRSKLPNSVLRRIWALADIDQDGMLDRDEFAVAMFLIDHKLDGNDIPDSLPPRLIPPSKKSLFRRPQPPPSEVHGEEMSWGGTSSGYGGGGSNSYNGGGRGGSLAGINGGSGGGGGRSHFGQPMEEYEEDGPQGLSSFVDSRH